MSLLVYCIGLEREPENTVDYNIYRLHMLGGLGDGDGPNSIVFFQVSIMPIVILNLIR
jgi:hypothetical protein